MKRAITVTLSGFCAGAVNGLLGAGGGMILVPLLSRYTDLQEEEVFPSSISIILPISVVSLICSIRTGPLDFALAYPYLLGSGIGGFIAGKWGTGISATLLHRLLGILILWGWDPISMSISFVSTLFVSTLLGFMTGLGIGGGSLLMLWLTLVIRADPLIARTVNLLFFIPSAVISCCFRLKQGRIPWKKIFPAMAAGCVSAVLFSWLGNMMQTDLLRKIFGGLLIVTGLREICYRPRKLR